jgi:hypothetical protein
VTEVADLEEGERVLWEGKPVRLAYAVTVPLLLLEGSFLLVVLATGAMQLAFPPPGEGGPLPLIPWFLPLLVLPSLMFVPGLIGAWRDASLLRYVLTDRRAIVFGAKRRTDIDLGTLGFLEVRPWSMGTSAVYFAPPQPAEPLSSMWLTGGYTTPGFRAIEDGGHVYRMILDARERLRQT